MLGRAHTRDAAASCVCDARQPEEVEGDGADVREFSVELRSIGKVHRPDSEHALRKPSLRRQTVWT